METHGNTEKNKKKRSRRKSVLSYLKARKNQTNSKAISGKQERYKACGRPITDKVYRGTKIGHDGKTVSTVVGVNRCKENSLCPSCQVMRSEGLKEELIAAVLHGVKEGRFTYLVTLAPKRPLDVGGFIDPSDVERISEYVDFMRKSWSEFSRRSRALLWASHFRGDDWTVSFPIYVNGKKVKAGFHYHYHLIVQTNERIDPLKFATLIWQHWNKAQKKVVKRARKKTAAYCWIKLNENPSKKPELVDGTVKGGVSVELVERQSSEELAKAVSYVVPEVIAMENKKGRRKNEAHNTQNSYSIGELIDLHGTKLEDYARDAYRLWLKLTYGRPMHMYSREKKAEPEKALRKRAYAKREEMFKDLETRLDSITLKESASRESYYQALTKYGDDLAKGMDEVEDGYTITEAVPCFEEDDRSQEEKKRELIEGFKKLGK